MMHLVSSRAPQSHVLCKETNEIIGQHYSNNVSDVNMDVFSLFK